MNEERKEYELTCLSPVHIGTGQILQPQEYFYIRQPNHSAKAYFLNQHKWAAFLLQHHLLDSYADKIIGRRRVVLADWLEREKHIPLTSALLQQLCYASAEVYMDRETKATANDIACQVKDVHGFPYIPGSSLKGAIHTAFLYHQITRNPGKYQSSWRELTEKIRHTPSYKKISVNSLQVEHLALSLLPQRTESQNDALQSMMRAIQVSDATLVKPLKNTIILQKQDASKKRGSNDLRPKGLPLFRECLPAGSKLRFTLKIDKDLLKPLQLTSLAELWQWVRAYTKSGLLMQEKVFGQDYRAEFAASNLATLLLGGGTGFLSKTVFYALAPDELSGREQLKKYFDYKGKFPKHRHPQLDDKIAPRTLKLARAGNKQWLLGLATVKEVTSC